jgi:hypothetical protein
MTVLPRLAEFASTNPLEASLTRRPITPHTSQRLVTALQFRPSHLRQR